MTNPYTPGTFGWARHEYVEGKQVVDEDGFSYEGSDTDDKSLRVIRWDTMFRFTLREFESGAWKLAALLLLFMSGCPTFPDSVDLNMTYRSQLKSNWCWAACDQMLLEHFEGYKLQYDIVTEVFGGPYDYSAGLGAGLGDLHEDFYKEQFSDYSLKYALTLGHPLVLGYTGPSGSHFRIVEAYDATGYTVFDPAAGISHETYQQLRANEDMTWDETHEISSAAQE